MYRIWSDDEKNFLIEHWSKYSLNELSKNLPFRTESAIYNKAKKLKLGPGNKIPWTDEELDFLYENWGKRSIRQIARNLPDRTIVAIIQMSKVMNLGSTKDALGRLTLRQLGKAIGVDHRVIKRWCDKFGLKHRFTVLSLSMKVYQISIEEYWKWAKENQELFDTKKFEPNTLGTEPEWMKVKRKEDTYKKSKKRNWTPEEDRELTILYNTNKYSQREIGEKLGKNRGSVDKRLRRLREKGEGPFKKEA